MPDKRKHESDEKRDAAKKSKRTDGTDQTATLYVTKLPVSLSSLQLTTLFSTYAPIRSAFVISTSSASDKTDAALGANAIPLKTKDRTAQSRGFGYVKFVLRDDAQNCLNDWAKGIPQEVIDECEGKDEMKDVDWTLLRRLKLDWAKRKLQKDEVAPATAFATTTTRSQAPRPAKDSQWPFDPEGARTVLIHGLPLSTSTSTSTPTSTSTAGDPAEEGGEEAEGEKVDWVKTVKHKCRKLFVPESVTILDLPTGEKAVSVLCQGSREAHQLISKTHNHVLKNYVVTALSKSSWDLVERKGKAQGGRLLIRNLAFDVKEEDLRCVFAPYGGIHSIHIPGTAPSPSATTSKGFAFVHFVHRTDAEKAITAVNGTRVRPGMARERAETEGGKLGNKKQAREAKKQQAQPASSEKGRLVAVDWALSKDEWKKQSADASLGAPVEKAPETDAESLQGRSSDSESGSDSDLESDDSDEEGEEDDDSDLEPIGLDESKPLPEANGTGDLNDDNDDEDDDKPAEKGTTLFVRNISFESTEPELYDLFKKFGPLRYARIVMDAKMNRSRGTAFVCFWRDEDAERVRELSDEVNSLKDATVASSSTTKSVLMPDPTSSKASQLTLHGRVLAVSEAVSKDRADKLREDRDKKSAATDRRNLYLMREGVIFPEHPLAKTLVASDLDARQASYESRKSLLRTNPSLFVSRTRLSIRQIPLYVTDGMLKRLANHAMRAFDKDPHVNKLRPEELADDGATGGPKKAKKTEKVTEDGKKKFVPESKVRQSKVLRQADRVDPLTGMGRSKGYGFLELDTHANALRVLRWANANRQVGTLFRKWWRDELERLIAKESSKDSGGASKNPGVTIKDSAERVKRLKEKLAELKEEEDAAAQKAGRKGLESQQKQQPKDGAEGSAASRSAKSLIIEFSIENAQTTKRRQEKIERARERSRKMKEQPANVEGEAATAAAAGNGGKGKKRKALAAPEEKGKKRKVDEAPAKLGDRIGGLIGKKRKQRKQKK